MATQRVRAGQIFRYEPVMLDKISPPYNVEPGDIVRVVNLHGCPRANTMGHCHVQHLGGKFAGLVCTNSLQPLTAYEKRIVKKALTPTKHRRPTERFNIEYGENVKREDMQ